MSALLGTHPDRGLEAAPGEVIFDTSGATDRIESHETEASHGGFDGLPAGTYAVKVQFKTNVGTEFGLFGSHLTVERAKTQHALKELDNGYPWDSGPELRRGSDVRKVRRSCAAARSP